MVTRLPTLAHDLGITAAQQRDGKAEGYTCLHHTAGATRGRVGLPLPDAVGRQQK